MGPSAGKWSSSGALRVRYGRRAATSVPRIVSGEALADHVRDVIRQCADE